MTIATLLRSRTLRSEDLANPFTINPMRSPLVGRQLLSGDTAIWSLSVSTDIGLAVCP